MPTFSDAPTAAPLAARLEHAVTRLRRDMELNLNQQSRVFGISRECQVTWCQQCAQLSRQFAALEAHLAAWMQPAPAPRLTIVGHDEPASCPV
jgi:hypothetical protein